MLNHTEHRSQVKASVTLASDLNNTEHPTIATRFTPHALKQAQRRGIHRHILALVLERHDRSQKVPGRGRALWIGRRGREARHALVFPNRH